MTTPLTPQPSLPLLQAPGTNTRISVRLAGQGVGLEWQPEWSGPHREGLGFCEGAGSGHEGKAQEMDLCPGVSPPSPSPSPHPEGAAAGAVHAAQLQVQTSVPQRHERQCSWQPPRIAALAGSHRMPISSRMVKCVGARPHSRRLCHSGNERSPTEYPRAGGIARVRCQAGKPDPEVGTAWCR